MQVPGANDPMHPRLQEAAQEFVPLCFEHGIRIYTTSSRLNAALASRAPGIRRSDEICVARMTSGSLKFSRWNSWILKFESEIQITHYVQLFKTRFRRICNWFNRSPLLENRNPRFGQSVCSARTDPVLVHQPAQARLEQPVDKLVSGAKLSAGKPDCLFAD